ncbi:hypothetical protein [Pseudomonas mangrovi]|uniref:Uncharacterized protein n=1 Tax=Pseudomonas mangrovi TaxID=2161748 RepID=A0A2T5PAE4_9PSED|nr:hypothetical protein [Pseudomonas mangrovi]PTU74661.1 hypothetical protein DBO85_08900 [Pseudomonas mangrovi]
MLALYSLLLRPRTRHFALVDRHGICRALRQCRQIPEGSDWVEVDECLPTWLNRPLPGSACVQPQASHARARRRLALS